MPGPLGRWRCPVVLRRLRPSAPARFWLGPFGHLPDRRPQHGAVRRVGPAGGPAGGSVRSAVGPGDGRDARGDGGAGLGDHRSPLAVPPLLRRGDLHRRGGRGHGHGGGHDVALVRGAPGLCHGVGRGGGVGRAAGGPPTGGASGAELRLALELRRDGCCLAPLRPPARSVFGAGRSRRRGTRTLW